MTENHFFCKKSKLPFFLLHISSSYAKIWGETKFQPWEFPRSWSKAIEVDRKKKEDNREEERKLVIRRKECVNNGQPCIANTTSGGARKLPLTMLKFSLDIL